MFRKPKIRHLLVVAMVALAGTLVALVARNFRWTEPAEIATALPGDADLSLKQIRYTETRDGKPRWTLIADAAAHALAQGTTRIENIRMVFHDVEGFGELTLTAREGEMKGEGREIEVRGDVVITSPNGYAFHTDHLYYDEALRQARTDAPVRIVSPTVEVTGTGMRLNVGNQTFELLAGVRARIAGKG
jgi:LPS export ABC transporter protein LptC